ncbi:MAG: flagellar assembly protein FliX [Rickettsiales bacterium]
MKIFGQPTVGNTSGVRRKGKSNSVEGSDFSALLDAMSEASESAAPPPPAPVSSTNMVLSIQAVSDEEIGRKKAYKQANQTLDALEDLKKSILLGDISKHQLKNISDKIEQMRTETNDPRLQQILDEVELRAAVELAKLNYNA